MQLQPGTLLQGGKYKIEKVLGQGGFGITYLANQELLDRQVCIKEFFFKEYCERNNDASHITLGTQSNSETVERFMAKFLKEARTISHLDHPNIIRIHDIFKENNTAYYVMDYVEGESLNEIVSRDGMLAESKAIDYIKQVASALDFIHQRGINHLDIKPANIMIRKSDNMAILIDFGLSKQYDAQGGQTSTTPVGISYGYAPMEQYNSGGVCTFSAQTDIYSLGATLYKLVTGNTPPQAMEILNDGLPQLPMTLSSGVKNAITSAMQVRKSDRPENISSFLNLLSNSCTTKSYDDYDSHRHQPKPQEDESTKILSNQEITEKTHQSSYVENILQPKVVMVEEKMEKKQNKYIWYILPIVIGALILLFNLNENDNKSAEDIYNEAVIYLNNNDYQNAIPLIIKSAEMGWSQAQSHLGYLYSGGEGVELNQNTAVYWWNKAFQQGNISATYFLGGCYYFGAGVEKDLARAVALWIEAAQKEDPNAQYSLGLCYYNGDGVEKDLVEAKYWLTKAAEQGNEDAKNILDSISISKITSTTDPSSKKLSYIDLGLPSGTLWADRNVGASTPTEYGGLYRWGNPQTDINGANKNVSSKNNIIGTEDDVAMKKMGEKWRTPSANQIKELLDFCQITLENIQGRNVAKFVGPNGNFIILPLTGVMYNYGRSQAGEFGIYDSGESKPDKYLSNKLSPISLSIFEENGMLKVNIADFFGKEHGNPVRGVYLYKVKDLQE